VHAVDPETFSAIVLDAVRGLPAAYRDKLANVDVQVEEWARPDDYARTRTPRGSTLLGVYRGIPLTRRGGHYNLAAPDTIVIFSGPIQRLARNEADLRERIERVVRHEIAHHFGISDERLHELDAY
jgi:predicted Zn-dependent protease with MMP-like domain